MSPLTCFQRTALALVITCVMLPGISVAQGLTGALIGTVKDEQGGIVAGARVTIRSSALIGGVSSLATNERGQLRFPALPPGRYSLVIEMAGLATLQEDDILIGAGATIERTAVLRVAGIAESVLVEGAGSRIDARDSGFRTRFGPEDLKAIPTRRASMFDFIRATPGVSPTSPGSGTTTSGMSTSVSVFGSGTNENQFLIDGTNFTCPCNGVARSEPGVDFIQEIQIQSMGASAEYGNVQGGVINVITRPATETKGLLAFIGGGTHENGLGARYGTDVPGGAFRVYARGFDRDNTVRANGTAVPDSWQNAQAGFRADWGAAASAFTLQGDTYRGTIDQLAPGDFHRSVSPGSELQAMQAAEIDLAALKKAGVVSRKALAAEVIVSGKLERKVVLK